MVFKLMLQAGWDSDYQMRGTGSPWLGKADSYLGVNNIQIFIWSPSNMIVRCPLKGKNANSFISANVFMCLLYT